MKAIPLVIATALAATGCKGIFGPHIEGSGKPGTRTVTVGSGKTLSEFKKIELDGAFDLEAKIGAQSDITVSGDDNLVNIVEFAMNGDTLVVKTSQNYSTHNPLKVSFTAPELQALSLNGSGNAHIDGLKGEDVSLEINGSGSVIATGSADKLTAAINGSGDMDLANLVAKQSATDISGSGSIKTNVTDSLTASLSGSGDILYKGSPKNVAKSINGSGEVKPF